MEGDSFMNLWHKLKELFSPCKLTELEKNILQRVTLADQTELHIMNYDLDKMLQRGTISKQAYVYIKAKIKENIDIR